MPSTPAPATRAVDVSDGGSSAVTATQSEEGAAAVTGPSQLVVVGRVTADSDTSAASHQRTVIAQGVNQGVGGSHGGASWGSASAGGAGGSVPAAVTEPGSRNAAHAGAVTEGASTQLAAGASGAAAASTAFGAAAMLPPLPPSGSEAAGIPRRRSSFGGGSVKDRFRRSSSGGSSRLSVNGAAPSAPAPAMEAVAAAPVHVGGSGKSDAVGEASAAVAGAGGMSTSGTLHHPAAGKAESKSGELDDLFALSQPAASIPYCQEGELEPAATAVAVHVRSEAGCSSTLGASSTGGAAAGGMAGAAAASARGASTCDSLMSPHAIAAQLEPPPAAIAGSLAGLLDSGSDEEEVHGRTAEQARALGFARPDTKPSTQLPHVTAAVPVVLPSAVLPVRAGPDVVQPGSVLVESPLKGHASVTGDTSMSQLRSAGAGPTARLTTDSLVSHASSAAYSGAAHAAAAHAVGSLVSSLRSSVLPGSGGNASRTGSFSVGPRPTQPAVAARRTAASAPAEAATWVTGALDAPVSSSSGSEGDVSM